MHRRLVPLFALTASLAVAACNAAPAAPALTDPKEILVQSLTSLQNVRTVQMNGTFGGNITAPGMGAFDLSTTTLTVAIDVEGKQSQLTLNAPTLLGTNVDVITLADAVYMKMTGPLAGMIGMDPTGKYLQMPVDSAVVPDEATDPTKAIQELRAGVDELPKAPEKLADEQINGADAYHVRLSLTGAELAALSGEAGASVGSLTFDLWSRKSDLRPARMTFAVDVGDQGNATGTFDLTYDADLNIAAPPADQVVTAP